MRGVVLAAGAGRRLRPVTDGLPKALVPVAPDTTILDLTLGNFAAVGITEAVLVVGYAAAAVRRRVPDLERRHRVTVTLVHNDRSEEWNNAYSLWCARDYLRPGALVVNGDTVHPRSVEELLLGRWDNSGVLLAVDDVKSLGEEEMKVQLSEDGSLRRISKLVEPAAATAEFIGLSLMGAPVADELVAALEATWRADPGLYYEDGFQRFVDEGGVISTTPVGSVEWVEVDDHRDLARAREIACRY